MSSLGAFAFAGVALIGWIGLGYVMGRRNDKRLAAARPGMTTEEAVTALAVAGADRDVAYSVIQWIGAYYGPETTPNATDRMKADIAIDPDDIAFFVTDFYKDNGIPRPSRKQPEVLPDYGEITLVSLAAYLTQRRAAWLNKERIEA